MLQFEEQKRMGGEQFHANGGELTFAPEQIEITLHPGETREGSFTVQGPEGDAVTGFVLPTGLSMHVLTPQFSGSRDEIGWSFDAAAYAPGDCEEGAFRIITSHGEYTLPFKVNIVRPVMDSSLGPVKSLFHYANLAKTNWREAVTLFYSKAFTRLFTDKDERLYTLYRGLSGRTGNEYNVEEFLIAAGSKEPMAFLPGSKQIEIDLPTPEDTLVVRRLSLRTSGWGYCRVRVKVNGAFLAVMQDTLTAHDFEQGTAEITYGIDPRRLHHGRNYGEILLETPFKTINIPVTVRYCASLALKSIHRKEQRQLVLELMQTYEDFRARRIAGKEFVSKEGQVIRRLSEIDRNNPVVQLYKIHYLLTDKKAADALWELNALNRMLSGLDEHLPTYSTAHWDLEDDVVYAYRMYLTELCAEANETEPSVIADISGSVIHAIESMHNGNPGNWWITWLMMYASGDYRRRPTQTWMLLQDQYLRDCRSPILYLEAWQMASRNPALLHDLDEFEEQVLLYAARHNLLTTSVMSQVTYLSLRRKRFSRRLFQVLTAGYAIADTDTARREILEAIVTLLIRGNETDCKYFAWYEKGVNEGLTVTRLFEYYMLSMPEGYEGNVPRMVIMYFAYQSTLPYERNAYLYRYLLTHEEEYREILFQYQPQIDAFSQDSLMQRRMSSDLAYLYQRWLTSGRVLTNEVAGAAIPAVFTVRLRCNDPAVHRVVLVYPRATSEQYFPIEGGIAYLPVYAAVSAVPEDNKAAEGQDAPGAMIFLEDDYGNRSAVSRAFAAEHVMNYERAAEALSVYETSNFGYDLYLSGMTASFYQITEENHGRFRALAESESIPAGYRQQVRIMLLRYYEQRDMVREMDAYLSVISPAHLEAPDRAEIIRYMVTRGLGRKAFSWIREFGTYGLDGETLMRLTTRLLYHGDNADDRVFAEVVHEAFVQGYYDALLLAYLGLRYDGLSSELEAIRVACVNFGVDEYPVTQRMLLQMLYTGVQQESREEMILTYRRGGADPAVLSAILAQNAHYYYIDGKAMPDAQFDVIADYGRSGVPLLDICRIAWLYRQSGKSGGMKAAEQEAAALFLQDLMEENIVFPFFRQFIGTLPELQAFADETLMEYRARSKHYDDGDAIARAADREPQAAAGAADRERSGRGLHIVYHYAMERNGRRDQYRTKTMKEMYDGVYVTGFLLFFGEQMHYFITDDEAEQNVVASGIATQDARIPEGADDRFGRINKISMLTALSRDDEAMQEIADYDKTAYLAARLFKEADHAI